MVFVNAETNSVNDAKSKMFTDELLKKGFEFRQRLFGVILLCVKLMRKVISVWTTKASISRENGKRTSFCQEHRS